MSEYTADPVSAPRRLERSRDDRWLAGVCGGLARYFGIHPAFYRVGFVVLTLLGGSGILVYLAAYLVIPAEGEGESIAAEALRHRGQRPWPLVALSLVGVAGIVLLSRATVQAPGDGFWLLLFLAGLVILATTRRSQRAAPADAPPQAIAAEDSRRVHRTGRIVGLTVAALAVLVLAGAGVATAVFDVHFDHGVGDRVYTVSSASELSPRYELGIGHMKLDLRDLRLPVGTTHVTARVDVGNLDVIVPSGAALRVNADTQAGLLDFFGTKTDGRDVDKHLVQSGKRVLVLDAHVGAGRLHVDRSLR